MNVLYRGVWYRVEDEEDIRTLINWCRLLDDLDRWLGLMRPGRAVA